MKNNIFFSLLACCLLYSFSIKAIAQEASLQFNDIGVSIDFKAEKIARNSSKKFTLDDNFNSQMYLGNDRILHRVVSDRESGLYFGYDLEVEFDSTNGKIKISVKPLSIQPIMEKHLKDLAIGSLTKYPESLVVEDGDTITLDILEQPQTKVKIVDIIKVKVVDKNKITPRNPKNSSKESPVAQDLKTENFQMMTLTNVKIFVNDKQVANPGSLNGTIIYFYIPEKGRFIFSLTPQEGYNFQKNGFVDGNEISFATNGNNFKLISSLPILSSNGRWNLWVLHDSDFRPDARFSSFSPYWMGAALRVEHFLKKKQ
jgi:hypothetical protein